MNFDLNKYKDAFADSLIELMNGKSIVQFSKEIGLPGNTVNNWILKKVLPRTEYLIILAQKFNCSIDYLLGLEK